MAGTQVPGSTSYPEERKDGGLLSETIGKAFVRAGKYVNDAFSELLAALGAIQFLGVEGAVSVAAVRFALLFHDRRSQDRLRCIVEELCRDAARLRQKGRLIDFKDERNIQQLFERIEHYLESKDELKLDLLMRVAKNGLIQQMVSLERERDFRDAIRQLEPQDINLILEMNALRKQARPVIDPDGSVPTDVNANILRKAEFPSATDFSFARLLRTGILESEASWDETGYRISRGGVQFLEYIERLSKEWR